MANQVAPALQAQLTRHLETSLELARRHKAEFAAQWTGEKEKAAAELANVLQDILGRYEK